MVTCYGFTNELVIITKGEIFFSLSLSIYNGVWLDVKRLVVKRDWITCSQFVCHFEFNNKHILIWEYMIHDIGEMI